MSEQHDGGPHDHKDGAMAVAVITPSGTFPNDDDYRRTYEGEIVVNILNMAAEHLHLANTADWVAFVDNRPIDPNKSFADNELCDIVEIEWHKHEGGGGA